MIIKIYTYNNDIEGFFDDYAIIIKSLIKYHEITQEMRYLDITKKLIDISIQKFYSKKKSFFIIHRNNQIN